MPDDLAVVVEHRQVPEAVLEHDPRRLLDIGVGRGRDRVGRHPLAHARLARVNPRRHRLEEVALGQDPDQPCRRP